MGNLNDFYKLIKNKTVSVIGLGISNTPLIKLLLEGKARVVGRDKKTADKFDADFVNSLKNDGVKLVLGENYLDNIREDIIIKAPGIRRDVPGIAEAVANGSMLTSEMELFFRYSGCKKFALTGSDGKTTTTTLTYLMLKKQYENTGITVHVGGNIGKPLFSEIKNIKDTDIAVLELSSFQLHAMEAIPYSAAITNVSPNHLDWHTDYEEYIDSKSRLFTFMKDGQAVLNFKNEICRNMAKYVPEGVSIRYFSPCGLDGVPEKHTVVYRKDGDIRVREANGKDILIMSVSDILLPGEHNVENYMCAVAELYGIVDNEIFVETAKTFGGVEHRIELVRELDGVKYYNSSIDSSPSRSIAALKSFGGKKVIAIMGGYDKHIPYDVIGEPVCEYTKAVVLTGATAPKIKEAVLACGKSVPEIIEIEDFTEAVKAARSIAENGDVVILSPASASFDKFKNFEERGNVFKKIVREFPAF